MMHHITSAHDFQRSGIKKLKKMLKSDDLLIINKSRLWFLMILHVWYKENFTKIYSK